MSISAGWWWLPALGTCLVGLPACTSSNADTTKVVVVNDPDGGENREPILDGGGTLPDPRNGPSLCPTGVCNYQTGAGCADAGLVSCVPLPSKSGGVAPSCEQAGTSPIGGACMTWTDCVAGAICANQICRKLCCGNDWTGCPSGEHCSGKFEVQIGTNDIVDTKAFLCLPANPCDPLDSMSCATAKKGTSCQLDDALGGTACLPEGTGVAGDPCRPDLPCKGGYACVDNGCRRLCTAVAGGGSIPCPPIEGRCVHFVSDPSGVGECTPL